MSQPHYPIVKSLIVPLEKNNLIIPMSLLVEMVEIDNIDTTESAGLEGWLNWKNRKIPLISIESLCFMADEIATELQTQCLILHTLTDTPDLPFIAVKVKSSPQTVEVDEDTMQENSRENDQRCPYIARHVRVANLPCMIPDLPAIEAVVAEIMRVGR